jgi:hypothetical protein
MLVATKWEQRATACVGDMANRACAVHSNPTLQDTVRKPSNKMSATSYNPGATHLQAADDPVHRHWLLLLLLLPRLLLQPAAAPAPHQDVAVVAAAAAVCLLLLLLLLLPHHRHHLTAARLLLLRPWQLP